MVLVVKTRTGVADVPEGYEPSDYPSFAVTVDIVIFTLVDGDLRVLLIRRGQAPFAGRWAICRAASSSRGRRSTKRPGGEPRRRRGWKRLGEPTRSSARTGIRGGIPG